VLQSLLSLAVLRPLPPLLLAPLQSSLLSLSPLLLELSPLLLIPLPLDSC